jgi:hypothetical protein
MNQLQPVKPHEADLRLLRTERKSEGKRLQEFKVKLLTVKAKKPQALAS